MFKLHILETGCQKMLAKPIVQACPRVGEEIRMSGKHYYRVDLVVWVLDEPECPHQRVNIGVSKIDPNEPLTPRDAQGSNDGRP